MNNSFPQQSILEHIKSFKPPKHIIELVDTIMFYYSKNKFDEDRNIVSVYTENNTRRRIIESILKEESYIILNTVIHKNGRCVTFGKKGTYMLFNNPPTATVPYEKFLDLYYSLKP